MRIFLADLGHNQVTVSSDTYPLGIANLAAYVRAYAAVREPLEIALFREPEHLSAALDDGEPDVLGLSNYAWNHELSLHFARRARAMDSQPLIVMGGPNFPLTADEQEVFLRSMPEIDVVVRGQTYEGERAFLNLIERFSAANHSVEGTREEPVPGNVWIDPKTGGFVGGADVERIRDLDEIPSPYLTGLMDGYFETGYFPLMQISRGCPFSCAYCNSSPKSNSRICSHSLDNAKADLLYIAEHVHRDRPLCLADDNFGMYVLDEEIADYIGFLQGRYDWPQYIRTTTGKNQPDRVARIIRKVGGRLPMTAAVQSLNPEVLRNISRSNIKLDTYSRIHDGFGSDRMQSYGELILCLPGETRDSFMSAVRDLLDAGVERISAHQLMLLPGAPLSTPESRARWGFNTRFRVVARNIGQYDGLPVVEVEEIVVETPTFSFDDYLETRIFHLLLTIFYYEGNFQEAFKFATQEGIKPFDLILRMKSMLGEAPSGLRRVVDDFVRESQEELFATREECLAWSRRHFAGLADGSIGGNLLSKYSMMGRFFATTDTLAFLEEVMAASLDLESDATASRLDAVLGYLRSVSLHSPFGEALSSAPSWTTSYDVETWRDEGYVNALEDYRYAKPMTFSTEVEPAQRTLIESRLATFGEHPSGLGKFTRTMFARDLRRALVREGSGA